MNFILSNNQEERRGTPLTQSHFSFFDFSQAPFKGDENKSQLSNTLHSLLQQLIAKLGAEGGFLAYGKAENQNVIYAGKVEPEVTFQPDNQRLLMQGKPLKKDGVYVHPIVKQNCLSGIIAVSLNPQTWKRLSEDLVHAYALLAAQNIEMQHTNDNLKKYADSLIQKKRELEKIQEYNQNLLSITTHDLSSPLNAVSGYLDMINHHLADDASSQKLNDYYKRIQSGVNDVSEMLAQLNEVIKFKKGFLQLNTVQVDINWLIKGICELLKANAAKKGIELQISTTKDPVYVDVDVVKFKRVIYNLVSNAIKYTERQRHIFVALESNGENVQLHIKDEGIGIPEDNLDSIFKPFVKLNASQNAEDGLSKGLGLYISSYFIELMGGEIVVKSRTGRGSTFTVIMPLVTDPECEARMI